MTLQELYEVRQELDKARSRVASLKKRLEGLVTYRTLRDAKEELRSLRVEESKIANGVRETAVELYLRTGQTRQDCVSIRLFDRLRYDIEEARGYCLAKLPQALDLNTEMFEGIAKKVQLDFVSCEKEPRAYIDREIAL